MPTAPVNEKVGHKRHQRKNIKNATINQILSFVIPNLALLLGMVTNEGERMTGKEGQRGGRRGRKYGYPAELTFQFIGRCCCCCCYIICQVDRVSRYYGFQNNQFYSPQYGSI